MKKEIQVRPRPVLTDFTIGLKGTTHTGDVYRSEKGISPTITGVTPALADTKDVK